MAGEVRRAIREGHTLRAIHEQQRERLGMSYRSFARYVQLYAEAERAQARGGGRLVPLVRREGEPLKVTLGPVAGRIRDEMGERDDQLV